jgi:putative phosphoesterase
MRIALLSDVHGNAQALEAVIADIDHSRADQVWFLGDAATLGPEPQRSVAMLEQLAPLAIEGNHDRYLRSPSYVQTGSPLLRQALEHALAALDGSARAYLGTFQRDVSIEIDGCRFHLCHGAPFDDEALLLPTTDPARIEEYVGTVGPAIVVYGHTHIPWYRTCGTRLINPGSVGLPYDGDVRASWAMLELSPAAPPRVEVRRVPYDRDVSVRLTRELGGPLAETVARRLEHARMD